MFLTLTSVAKLGTSPHVQTLEEKKNLVPSDCKEQEKRGGKKVLNQPYANIVK